MVDRERGRERERESQREKKRETHIIEAVRWGYKPSYDWGRALLQPSKWRI